MSPILAAVVAAATTMLLTPVVIGLARRTNVMDHPGELKPHAAPVPYLGGVAVFGGVAVGLLGFPHPAVLVPLFGALLLGVLDDITSLAVIPRLLTEIAIGFAVVWSVGIDGWLVGGAVVIGTVVMINAVNFVDGIDALAAGICAVSFVGFSIVLSASWSSGGAALAGAAVGFLAFNRPPARIYLGDAGSYLLGTALAMLTGGYLVSTQSTHLQAVGQAAGPAAASTGVLGTGVNATAVVVIIAVMGYPVVEVVSTVARRFVSRRSLFAGDRDHVYDRLVARGRSRPLTAAMLIGTQAVVVAAGVAVHETDSAVLAIVVGALVVAATAAAAAPRRTAAS